MCFPIRAQRCSRGLAVTRLQDSSRARSGKGCFRMVLEGRLSTMLQVRERSGNSLAFAREGRSFSKLKSSRSLFVVLAFFLAFFLILTWLHSRSLLFFGFFLDLYFLTYFKKQRITESAVVSPLFKFLKSFNKIRFYFCRFSLKKYHHIIKKIRYFFIFSQLYTV